MDKEPLSSNLLSSCLNMTCPQCRATRMFKKPGFFVYFKTFEMHANCGKCGLKFELEPGFWYGALWASYPLLIIIEFPFLLMSLFKSWGNYWSPLVIMAIVFIILWPTFIRLGRSIWVHAWVKFIPNGQV